MPRVCLICATISVPFADVGTCGKCGATVYPSKGSLDRALRENLDLICIDCASRLGDFDCAGIMHRGRMLPSRGTEEILAMMLAIIAGQGRKE